jgi:hypothetical protein
LASGSFGFRSAPGSGSLRPGSGRVEFGCGSGCFGADPGSGSLGFRRRSGCSGPGRAESRMGGLGVTRSLGHGVPSLPAPRWRQPLRPGAPSRSATRAKARPARRRDSGWSEHTDHRRSVLAPANGYRTTWCYCRRGSARARRRRRGPLPDAPQTDRPLGRRVGERGPNPVPAAKRSARSSRQAARATRPTTMRCRTPLGASSRVSAASSAANPAASSSGSTRCFAAQSPCFKAFRDERALPSVVFGPREIAPLRRLARA